MKLSPLQSVFWIVCSTYLITGGTFKGMKYFNRQKTKRNNEFISRIIQTGPQREALKTSFLAQQMNISADRPVVAHTFDPILAEKKLLSSPVIKEAKVELMKPDTVYVDYTIRRPIAWLYDFENIAIDDEGYPFPIFPFFTPKKLPEIYLGIEKFSWNVPLADRHAKLAITLMDLFGKLPLHLLRLDVSNAFHPSLGRREIVVTLEEEGRTLYLRLTPKNFAQELGNYLELRKSLPQNSQIIDLRISKLAFITEKKGTQTSEP